MRMRRPDRTRWLLLLLASALLLPGCLVNPVPTPGTSGSLAESDSGFTNNAQDVASAADATTADSKNADATDSAVPGVNLGTLAESATSTAAVFAFSPDAPSSGKLVVFLPDSAQQPSDYMTLAVAIAQQGHRVLVLPVTVAAQTACAGDGTCLDLARQEILDGQDRTSKITVTTADCLQTRLVKTLTSLDKDRPGENWGKFYAGSSPIWSDILIAGHGEGASEAASVALHLKVWRVALLAGPTDGVGATPSNWLSGTSKTPTSAWRAFAHTKDATWAIIVASWTALGLGSSAAAVSVDGNQQPGISVQLLTTAMNVPDPRAAIAVDGQMPTDVVAEQHLRLAWKVLFWPY